MAKGFVVVLCTNSTTDSGNLKDFKVSVDDVINDEAGHSSEWESLIPITSTEKSSRRDRLHVVTVGDYLDFPPVLQSQQPITFLLRSESNFQFNMKSNLMLQSLFEKILSQVKAPQSWLKFQYRRHPAIGKGQMSPTYEEMHHPPVARSRKSVQRLFESLGCLCSFHHNR